MSYEIKLNEPILEICNFPISEENINHDERSIVHYVSSNAINRYGYIVDQNGIDWTNFEKTGKNVLFNHNDSETSIFPMIGTNVWHKVEGDRTKVKTQFNRNMTNNPNVAVLAEDAWNGILNGWKPASSIHFAITEKPIENENGIAVVHKSELLNYALVINPANTDSIMNFMNSFNKVEIKSNEFKQLKNQIELHDKINSFEEIKKNLLSEVNVLKERIQILESSKHEIVKQENTKDLEKVIKDVLLEKNNNYLTVSQAKTIMNEILFGKVS